MKAKILLLIAFCVVSFNSFAQTPTNMSICGVSFSNNFTTFKDKMATQGIYINGGSNSNGSGELKFAGIEKCRLFVNPYSFDDVYVHHIELSIPDHILNPCKFRELLGLYSAKYGKAELIIKSQSELYVWEIKNNIGKITLEMNNEDHIVINYYDYKNRNKHFSNKEYFKDI